MTTLDEAYRIRARTDYADEDLQIDDRAIVSLADDGAWVAAWVWVAKEDVDHV